ncbi:MAG TPA: THxN family PEP-CTERM protein [Rubrivivax sp.]|nr:THxN family PEP-CTERM protein [Rubrivivax sp.]
MKQMIKMVAAAALAVAGASAQADFINTWSYNVTTEWVTAGAGAPTFGSGTGTQIVTPSEISWGGDNNGSAPGVGNLIIGGGERSGLRILGSPQNGSVNTNAIVPGPVATFQHVNNSLSGLHATLLTASVITTLTLQPTDPAGSPLAPQSLTFQIDFAETTNLAGTCIPEATTVCDDVFVLAAGSLNQQFVVDGITYYVSFLDLQSGPLTPLSPQACAAAGAPSGCLGFWTGEGQAETIDFGLVITGQPISVPEPGVLALAGLGLLGAVAASRRRRPQA